MGRHRIPGVRLSSLMDFDLKYGFSKLLPNSSITPQEGGLIVVGFAIGWVLAGIMVLLWLPELRGG